MADANNLGQAHGSYSHIGLNYASQVIWASPWALLPYRIEVYV